MSMSNPTSIENIFQIKNFFSHCLSRVHFPSTSPFVSVKRSLEEDMDLVPRCFISTYHIHVGKYSSLEVNVKYREKLNKNRTSLKGKF